MNREPERQKSSKSIDKKEKRNRSSSKSKDRSKNVKSKSRSPEKLDESNKGGKSVKSAKIHRNSHSKSPSKRKSTGLIKNETISVNNLQDSSYFSEAAAQKSTADMDDFSSQGLTSLNQKIFHKITLKKLILSGNNLRSLPSAIADLVHLEYLDLSRNPLKVKDVDDSNCLPIEMRLLKNLKFLGLSECNLRNIPTTVWLCVSLESLDLSRNKIGLLVPDIGNLQNLMYLNLSQCNLTTLPGEIGFCTELREIILMSNQIESLPDTLKDCKNIEMLKLSYRTFNILLDSYMENLISKGQIKSEHIPLVVFELEKLKSLDLKSTKINNIPENNLKGLKELYLDHNYFDNFSENVMNSMSSTLRVLTIPHNLFKQIPAEINNLSCLEILDLSYNLISSISNNSNLFNLKELYLNNNNLVELNDDIKYFKNLKKLTLDKNNLKNISEHLYDLEYLEYLDLSNNDLTKISPNIYKLQNLKIAHSYDKLNKIGLWVIGNALKIPPKEIWQTTNIDKIYEYLYNYNQRNLDYVFYAKLIFLGSSGCGKTNLVNSFFNYTKKNDADQEDFKTKIARRLYKRTLNKVEWLILDLGGDEVYRSIHSTIFSSIDPEDEPTLFVIVYNHTNYTSSIHKAQIGSWIESILIHNRISSNNTIQIKLIGIIDDENELESNKDFKINNVLNDTYQTIENWQNNLLTEKHRLKTLIKNLKNKEKDDIEQETNLNKSLNRLESMMQRKINLNGEILLIESVYKKESVNNLLKSLEDITIRFNKIVPLDLKIKLKNHIIKLKKSNIDLKSFLNSINNNNVLSNLIRNNPKCELNLEKLLNYAKTIGDVFWLKYNKTLNNQIYLHFDYLLNVLKLFIRHDIKNDFIYNENTPFKSIGLYESMRQFNRAADLASKYGIFEQKLIYGICFSTNQFNCEEMKDCVNLLQDLAILYKSESQSTDEKCSYYRVVVPSLCSISFEKDKKLNKNSNQNQNYKNELFSEDYELYFLHLDKIREFRSKIKAENALRKQKKMWNYDNNLEELEYSKENEAFDEDDQDLKLINLNTIYDLIDSKNDLINMNQNKTNSSHKLLVECNSNFKFEHFLFDKLSVLIQEIVHERFDWNDTIIARDIDNCCFKIQLLNQYKTNDSIIRIEVKIPSDFKDLEKLKNKLFEIIDDLFEYYPGLSFCLSTKLFIN